MGTEARDLIMEMLRPSQGSELEPVDMGSHGRSRIHTRQVGTKLGSSREGGRAIIPRGLAGSEWGESRRAGRSGPRAGGPLPGGVGSLSPVLRWLQHV